MLKGVSLRRTFKTDFSFPTPFWGNKSQTPLLTGTFDEKSDFLLLLFLLWKQRERLCRIVGSSCISEEIPPYKKMEEFPSANKRKGIEGTFSINLC